MPRPEPHTVRAGVAAASRNPGSALVSLRGICKTFPGVVALDEVNFDLAAGEVHALLGENGAGKSTLMAVLTGLIRPDAGMIRVDGEAVSMSSPRDALRRGIAMVHQQLLCSERHTVLQNIALGWSGLAFLPRRRALRQAVAAATAPYGLGMEKILDTPMHALAVATRQKVEIARALLRGARVLVLDEPTAVLAPREADRLFELIRAFCRRGGGVVFISHKLDEVTALADRITVMRRGKQVACHDAKAVDAAALAVAMLGEPAPAPGARDAAQDTRGEAAPEVVRLAAVTASGDGVDGAGGISEVSLVVRAGEMVGVAGVAGSGQAALAEVLAGLRRPASGTLTLLGRVRAGRDIHPRAFARDGVAYIPADRHRSGVAAGLSVADNLLLRRYRDVAHRGVLRRAAAETFCQKLLVEHDIRCAGPRARAATLSGGNLQKLIVARELAGGPDRAPQLIIAAYPFRGLDVGAVAGVRARLLEARARGAAVVLLSEDTGELLGTCDRIGVLFRGRLVGVVDAREATAEVLGLWMGGRADGAAQGSGATEEP